MAGRSSCCFIDNGEYDALDVQITSIKGCSQNWFNIWFPRLMTIFFVVCYLAAVIPTVILTEQYIAFGQNIWLLIMPAIFHEYTNFIPTEMKIDGSNIYIKMGSCRIQPYVKLTNARVRKVHKLDLMSCKWPRCWCNEHLHGLNWAEHLHGDTSKMSCIQGDFREGCATYPAYVMITPAIDGADEIVTSELHNV